MNTTNAPQTEADHPPKLRGYRYWIIRIALLLGLPVLFYYGYCWGLWGQRSLLLQYLFQCSCPPASEEARYPRSVDVIVSACSYVSSILSPSGRLLYVEEEGSGIISTYLLDFQTEKKTPFILEVGSNYFLTDELIFHSFYGDNEYMWDMTTGNKYPIKRFASVHPEAYVNGELNLNILTEALREAKDVYLIDDDNIIALTVDFYKYPERNFNILRSAFPGGDANRAEQFLQQHNIAYHYVSDGFPSDALSPDNRFIARADGIYLTATGQKIVEGYSARGWFHSYSGKDFSVRGWIYDSTAVVYSKFLNPCLIEASFFLSDEPGCFFEVHQPLFRLNLPEEYSLRQETP
jgi:hypothetical protein